ncbi:MAG: pyridoxamine 5'-phosphate oxidase family protein [Alkalispirochaetaceae bacterium]
MHRLGDMPGEQQLTEIWNALEEGVASARHPFHTAVLATVGAHCGVAEAGEARTVVLRGVDRGRGSVIVHSHRESGKISQIRRHPGVTLLLYDPEGRRQLRLKGKGEVHLCDTVSAERWNELSEGSRECYLAPHPPGAVVDPEAEGAERAKLSVEEGYRRFAVIEIRLGQIEALFLDHRGHRRRRWDLEGGEAKGIALAP